MSVSAKGKRKITVENRKYIWYVGVDCDSPYYILNIISEDKSLLLSLPLKTKTSYVISKGKCFQHQKSNGIWNRYRLPFSIPEIITPKFVSQVIIWATQNQNAVLVKWNGSDVPV